MALSLLRTPAAERDLIEIWTYIAEDNLPAADRVLDRFDELLAMLASNPLAGRARPELGDDLRSMASGKHVLFYRIDGSRLMLVRVLSGSRDITADAFG